jgi:hypothetical protein
MGCFSKARWIIISMSTSVMDSLMVDDEARASVEKTEAMSVRFYVTGHPAFHAGGDVDIKQS